MGVSLSDVTEVHPHRDAVGAVLLTSLPLEQEHQKHSSSSLKKYLLENPPDHFRRFQCSGK